MFCQYLSIVALGGKCCLVGVPPFGSEVTLSAFLFSMQEKWLIGSFYGSPRPHYDMPRIIDLYMAGRLKLDQLVSQTFALRDINRAFEALEQGRVARSVIAYS